MSIFLISLFSLDDMSDTHVVSTDVYDSPAAAAVVTARSAMVLLEPRLHCKRNSRVSQSASSMCNN